MSGLEDTFEGQVEFILLDYDDDSLDEQRNQLGITDRSQYVLSDADGTVLKRWYGILDEGTVTDEIEALIVG